MLDHLSGLVTERLRLRLLGGVELREDLSQLVHPHFANTQDDTRVIYSTLALSTFKPFWSTWEAPEISADKYRSPGTFLTGMWRESPLTGLSNNLVNHQQSSLLSRNIKFSPPGSLLGIFMRLSLLPSPPGAGGGQSLSRYDNENWSLPTRYPPLPLPRYLVPALP